MARIIDATGFHRAKKPNGCEAAEMWGLSERHFRRLRDAYGAEGAEGIVGGRQGRPSGRRAPVDEIEGVVEEFQTRDFDFTAKHLHEAILSRPMSDGPVSERSYTWTEAVLQSRGRVTEAPKRSVHRKKRVRRPSCNAGRWRRGAHHRIASRRGTGSRSGPLCSAVARAAAAQATT